MSRFGRQFDNALDRHITGNYGEDQFERELDIPSFPNKKYNIIYADPAWNIEYFKELKDGIAHLKLPYDTMTDEEIINLPIKDIADDNAILFIWCIDSRIPIIQRLMSSWGFEYKCVAFVWNKKAKTTKGVNANWGKYTRKSCEFCFLGTRGKVSIKCHTQNQFILESKRQHSRKPDVVRNMIIKMCGHKHTIRS